MIVFQHNVLLKTTFVMILFLTAAGCVTVGMTKPNEPYQGRDTESLNAMAGKNLLLSKELGKLPEIQDGISPEEKVALEGLVRLYNLSPDAFDRAFEQMYQVGLPEVRKYCSPLQALFWLAEDGKHDQISRIVGNYSLEALIKEAWGDVASRDKKVSHLSEQEIQGIINRLSEKDRKLFDGVRPEVLNYFLTFHYNEHPGIYSKEDREIIEASMESNKNYLRWKTFSTVADRLNAPELVAYYLNHFVVYRGYKRAHGTYPTFKFKQGHCVDAAFFATDMLRRSGYNTFMRMVVWGPDTWIQNHTGSGIILDDGRYLIVADFTPSGNSMTGPHETIEQVDTQLASRHKITDRRWGTNYPP
jgi:hypothetical protein